MTLSSRNLPAHHPWRMPHLQQMTIYTKKNPDFSKHISLVHRQPCVVLTSQWTITCQLSTIKTTHGIMKDKTKQLGRLFATPSIQAPNQSLSTADSLLGLCSFNHSNLVTDRQLHFSSTKSLGQCGCDYLCFKCRTDTCY